MQQSTKRVLHVDDRSNWLRTIRMILEHEGYEVTSFSNLPSAKKAAKKENFNYYICDHDIAGENGGVWAAELRKHGKKAMILGGDGHEDVPFLSKSEQDLSGKLLSLLQSL